MKLLFQLQITMEASVPMREVVVWYYKGDNNENESPEFCLLRKMKNIGQIWED